MKRVPRTSQSWWAAITEPASSMIRAGQRATRSPIGAARGHERLGTAKSNSLYILQLVTPSVFIRTPFWTLAGVAVGEILTLLGATPAAAAVVGWALVFAPAAVGAALWCYLLSRRIWKSDSADLLRGDPAARRRLQWVSFFGYLLAVAAATTCRLIAPAVFITWSEGGHLS